MNNSQHNEETINKINDDEEPEVIVQTCLHQYSNGEDEGKNANNNFDQPCTINSQHNEETINTTPPNLQSHYSNVMKPQQQQFFG